jgi:hypothetical protein
MCYLPLVSGKIWPTQNELPDSTVPVSSPRKSIAVTEHLKWARTIALGVRRAYNFSLGSQEEEDLIATAYLAIVELVKLFDPSQIPPGNDLNSAFRGWAAIAVRCCCQREARRLRNGGTYSTRRERACKPVVVERLRNGPDLIDPRSFDDEEKEEACDDETV